MVQTTLRHANMYIQLFFQEANIRSILQQTGKEIKNGGIKNNIRIRIILYSKLD